MTDDPVATAFAACAARLGDDATAVLSRLAGPLGEDARGAARDLAMLDEATAKRRRAEIAALARAPGITSIRGAHPSWLDAALAELPERARTAVSSVATAEVDVWLARWATAALPPRADDRAPPVLMTWLRAIATDQLAYALGAQAATPTAPRELREAAARIARPPRLGGLGSPRAALARCRGASLDDELSLVAIAARALAPHLASHPLAILSVSRRLPYEPGSALEREIVAHASAPLADAPTWAALVAS